MELKIKREIFAHIRMGKLAAFVEFTVPTLAVLFFSIASITTGPLMSATIVFSLLLVGVFGTFYARGAYSYFFIRWYTPSLHDLRSYRNWIEGKIQEAYDQGDDYHLSVFKDKLREISPYIQ